jgi:hypothetical protein
MITRRSLVLGGQPPKQGKVIARLIAERSDGLRIIAEVHEGATFMNFFDWSTQQGRRWSTKKHTRFSSRNDGLSHINAHRHTPGIEALKTKLESLTLVKYARIDVKIFKKRAYGKLIHAAPDALGPLPIVKPYSPTPASSLPIRVVLPEPRRRYSITNGWVKQ